jgi:histidine triad (HIT) family protein
MASVFTRILKGELPCYKIHEDEYTFSFLTLGQVQVGHTLVIPKTEVDHFFDVPEPYYSAVFKTAKLLAPALLKTTGAKRIGTCVVGLEVPHFHYHMIPISQMSDFNFSLAKELPAEKMKEIQQKIVANLK